MKFVFSMCFIIVFSLGLIAQVQTQSPIPAPGRITIDPKTLRERILDENISVLLAMNQVHQAKDQMNIARGNLLPSVNLGMVLSIMSGPSFALGMVEFLLPFLLPSRWFDYFQQRDLLEAEKESYHALQLNTYASAASIYYTHLSDVALKEIVIKEYNDLAQVHAFLVKRDTVLGNVPPSDILFARSQAELSQAKVAKLEELLVDERSHIRQALSLPIETEMSIAESSVPASSWEQAPVGEALKEALNIAPESRQVEFLLKAAKAGKWSKIFAFINGASVSTSNFGGSSGVKSVSFDNLSVHQSVNFGFAYFPAIQLAQHNIENVQLRRRELLIENTQILEKVILSLKQAIDRQTYAQRAQDDLQKVYDASLRRFDLGLESLVNVIIKRRQMTEASAEKVAAEASLNLLRVTLNRTLLLDEFRLVPGCHINPETIKDARGGAWDWIKNIFTGKNLGVTIDKACRGHG